jgi:hypothetical protein
MYPLESIKLATHRSPPKDVPTVAMNNILSGYWADSFGDFNALRENGSISKTAPADNSTLDPYWSRRVRQAYWAALTYTDENVGKLVSSAKQAGLYDNTIVVLWGDHGYQLGDNDQWSKVCVYKIGWRTFFCVFLLCVWVCVCACACVCRARARSLSLSLSPSLTHTHTHVHAVAFFVNRSGPTLSSRFAFRS